MGLALTAGEIAFHSGLRVPAQAQRSHDSINKGYPVRAIQDIESAEQKSERMRWFREARFGMFIHWGLYAMLAGSWNGKEIPDIGEWIMNTASIPVSRYKALASGFNPREFSAKNVVALAKSAGMKYIVITSKHHDGFAMFRSQANPFLATGEVPLP